MNDASTKWWESAVLYQIYPRSFQDTDGDGIGDLRGIIRRLDHLAYLGVDGFWITPVFASPQFDYGYDVSDYRSIHPEFGSLADMDELIVQAHRRGLKVILDLVMGHTSIEHPWFRQHPDWYILADHIPNNWISVFGGPAWTLDEQSGRYYYHRFYAEQPSLNWANLELREAMHDVVRFWIERGADGFRLDAFGGIAVDPELRNEPRAQDADLNEKSSNRWLRYRALDHIHTVSLPQVFTELSRLHEAFPNTLFITEEDLPNQKLQPYAQSGGVPLSFELIGAHLDGISLRQTFDTGTAVGSIAWALSNHDYPRLVSRWGRQRARLAAVMLLTLPGIAIIYQGDEIGMVDGPKGEKAFDRCGRDRHRHPMQWDAGGGFTTGKPWLPLIDPTACNVADQRGESDSTLEVYRRLIELRKELGAFQMQDSEPEFVSFQRGTFQVALNLGTIPRPLPSHQSIRLETIGGGVHGQLPPLSAAVLGKSPKGQWEGGSPEEGNKRLEEGSLTGS